MSLSVQLAIVIVTWIVGLFSSVSAIMMGVRNPGRYFCASVALATVVITIGHLGFGHWTPVHFLPQIAYTWSSGDSQFGLASGWFFIGPLLLGLAALLVAIRGRRKSKHATESNLPGNAV